MDLAPPLEETSSFCLFASVTGRPCPTCGGTRAIISLLTFDVDEAFSRNLPVTLLVLTGLVLLIAQGKRVYSVMRQPQPVARALQTAGDQIVRHPAVAAVTYLLMWAWNVARW
jgi:hypothetical protein